ncbi:MAG: hypothetical protein ACYTHJ_11640 [Planctomycetota bacterium]|jgi:hypothetical protein
MKLRISLAASDDHGLRTMVERKLVLALARFRARIKQLHVRFEDLNGPKGGMDKRCRLEASLDHESANVFVTEVVDSEYEFALHRAVQRMSRRIGDHLGRRRALRWGQRSGDQFS